MWFIKSKTDRLFFLAGFLLTIVYLLLLEPVPDVGDGPAYLRYAQIINENGDTNIFIHRAPLYPWILSIFLHTFENSQAINGMFILQYFLLFISMIFLYKILLVLFEKESLAFCASIIALINFSAIFYGFMLLTETMTLFFLILSLWFLINSITKSSLILLFLCGVSVSAMILTRFNTLPMLFIFLGIIFILELKWKQNNFIITFRNLVIFIIPSIFILNGYAFLNYQKHNFYGLFPEGGSPLVSRNALVATLDGTEKVSGENKVILNIFLSAEEKFKENRLPVRKGSLISNDKFQITEKLYKGYPVYLEALPHLCRYFNINPSRPEPDLSEKLIPFYREIRKLNRNKIRGMRIMSFLSSFRSSTSLVIGEKPDVNFGKLPAWVIIGYKLTVIAFSVMVFFTSVIYLVLCVWKLIKTNWTVIMFILIVFGFFFINFAFATESNANRFKFPAEPLIIGLGIYYIYLAYITLIKWKINEFKFFQVPGLKFQIKSKNKEHELEYF